MKRNRQVQQPIVQPSRLERLKRERFPVEGRAERVARSLAALSERSTIELPLEAWKQIAENADDEDES